MRDSEKEIRKKRGGKSGRVGRWESEKKKKKRNEKKNEEEGDILRYHKRVS